MNKVLMVKLFVLNFLDMLKPNLKPSSLIWRYCLAGVSVRVQWPASDSLETSPFGAYRPWLEEHVGQQGWDWNWQLTQGDLALTITFRRGKAEWASMAALKWA